RENLLGGPPETLLPANEQARAALAAADDPAQVAGRDPSYCAAWAELAGRVRVYGAAGAELAARALAAGDPVSAYAFARTGYHRGLDQLRRAGWHGHGAVPWEHEPNQGFLRALYMLGTAAAAIGEDDEAVRCQEFLADSSETAVLALSGA